MLFRSVMALQGPHALSVVSAHPSVGVCLMHMKGLPASMQEDPHYEDVTTEVLAFLRTRLEAAVSAGIDASRLVVDPGYGFGKTLAHNLQLAQGQTQLKRLGRPVLVGWSRKGTLGRLTGRAVEDRLAASVAAALAAVHAGAHMVRVHDVAATVDALKVWRALNLLDKGGRS